uniref:Uncharacterized protein n=1 Tax=Helicotheca tamesis TaxID=374047 RepID=A0A7S2E0Y6_9STRA|mmetsp:Transcript_11590/g.16090  ORF Transcript_11590/g.16090 Transcript_11590/m.16090 type:complete len:100 (+) Transcript_11590:45-344(+)|eukprot:CAMPEP_0185738866 /NCGR_PEP_ID=MMETSP1171-20130828/34109_1 /TAXON_ID=374046 /ORGANISM="Helicotheca tamensis, Strain CCMP826" /LENGTH=99 /DNA_ID=CAMNT_0028410249 /DNA_START=28 /DNA_END=327 /DNA_ORIENTATION=+
MTISLSLRYRKKKQIWRFGAVDAATAMMPHTQNKVGEESGMLPPPQKRWIDITQQSASIFALQRINGSPGSSGFAAVDATTAASTLHPQQWKILLLRMR